MSRPLRNWVDKTSNRTTKSEEIFQDLRPKEV
jgi:hypothetical protein